MRLLIQLLFWPPIKSLKASRKGSIGAAQTHPPWGRYAACKTSLGHEHYVAFQAYLHEKDYCPVPEDRKKQTCSTRNCHVCYRPAQQDTAMCVTDQLGEFMTNWAHAQWKKMITQRAPQTGIMQSKYTASQTQSLEYRDFNSNNFIHCFDLAHRGVLWRNQVFMFLRRGRDRYVFPLKPTAVSSS